jgi:tRNA(adenine34) deaminase
MNAGHDADGGDTPAPRPRPNGAQGSARPTVAPRTPPDDERWMRLALQEAEQAFADRETPVGAVAVHEGRLLGRGHNRVEALGDPTAHAEILTLGSAAQALGEWRLAGVTLYVTLEPCTMCAGAILLARVARLVYGTRDPRAGACGSFLDVVQGNPYRHDLAITDGCLEHDALALLQAFYRDLRARTDPPG